MRKALLVVAIAFCLSCVGAGASFAAIEIPASITFHFNGSVVPKRLPATEKSQVSLSLSGRTTMSDQSSPPPLQKVSLFIDRHVTVEVEGLPSCSRRKIESGAKVCRDSIVGTGYAHSALIGDEPALVRFRLFNGGTRQHVTTFFARSSVSAATPTPVVVKAQLRHLNAGSYGSVIEATLPSDLDGEGLSVMDFQVELDKQAASASCPKSRQLKLEVVNEFITGAKVFGSDDLPCLRR